MKKIDIGQTITIFANLGVIAGIVFLGIELRQNNESLAIQTRLYGDTVTKEAFKRQINNPAYVHALAKLRRGEGLTDEDLIVLDMENAAVIMDFQMTFGLIKDGVLKQDLPVLVWRSAFHEREQGLADYWIRARRNDSTPSEFEKWMEENVLNLSD